MKKGDKVTIKNAKKYDSLSKKDTLKGTVLFVSGNTVSVKVGSGQYNVEKEDISLEESLMKTIKIQKEFQIPGTDVILEKGDQVRMVENNLDKLPFYPNNELPDLLPYPRGNMMRQGVEFGEQLADAINRTELDSSFVEGIISSLEHYFL